MAKSEALPILIGDMTVYAQRIYEEIIAPLEMERDELRKRLTDAREPASCSVCAGSGKPLSGKPCICDGAGTEAGEMAGLRRLLYKYKDTIAELHRHLLALEGEGER